MNPGAHRPGTKCLWFQFLKVFQLPGTREAADDQLRVQEQPLVKPFASSPGTQLAPESVGIIGSPFLPRTDNHFIQENVLLRGKRDG